ncbi:hypothetical protein Tco_1191965 [Tanacetum coccineum]
MVRGGKLRGHIPGVGPVLPGYVRSRLSYKPPVGQMQDVDFMVSLDEERQQVRGCFCSYDSVEPAEWRGSRARDVWQIFFGKNSENAAVSGCFIKKMPDFSTSDMSLGKIPLKTKLSRSFPSDMSLGNLLPPWHQFLDQKIRGAHFSLGIVAGERFAIELTPSTFPQRHFAGDRFPQRHVAGERVGIRKRKALEDARKLDKAGEESNAKTKYSETLAITREDGTVHIGTGSVNESEYGGNGDADGGAHSSGNGGTPSFIANVATTATVSPTIPISSASTSYAKLVAGDKSKKSVNFRTLITQAGNGAEVAVLLESIQAISERFTNTT